RFKVQSLMAELLIYGGVRFPAHAEVQRDLTRYFPGVLNIQRAIELAAVIAVECALAPGRRSPKQKVRHGIAGNASIEGRIAGGIHASGRPVVQALVIDAAAEPDLVRTLQPGHIFEEGPQRSVVRFAGRCSAASNQERAVYGQRNI